jgi:rhodanese-related sulfurtransferase
MLKTIPVLMTEIKASINTSTANEAFEQLSRIDGVLIDVREPNEFEQQSVKGAVNISRGLLEMKMLQLYPNAEQVIFVHCASGARACFAAEQLMRLGYQNVTAITCKLDSVCEACDSY